jgi:hypothetical protein
MLYNGVDLPNIETVWTDEVKATHPYAIMFDLRDSFNPDNFQLELFTMEVYAHGDGFMAKTDGERITYRRNAETETWEYFNTYSYTADSLVTYHIHSHWSSYDIKDINGNVFLAGSEPVDGNEKYCILGGTLAAIAAAIRKLKGTNKPYKPTEMPGAIEPDVVTAIDYSTWASGAFSETLDNGAKLTYTVENDTEGRPSKVTRPDGSEVEVAW